MFSPLAVSWVERVTFPIWIGIGGGAHPAETSEIEQKASKSLAPEEQRRDNRSTTDISRITARYKKTTITRDNVLF
jgi:hypothetical protein